MTRRLRGRVPWVKLLAVFVVLGFIFMGLWIGDQFAKQKVTMGRMQDASNAFQVYALKHGRYPGSMSGLAAKPAGADELWPLKDPAPLASFSQAIAVANERIETVDGWGRPIIAGVTADGLHYILASGGLDGRLERSYDDNWPKWQAWNDVILVDGAFVSAPSGVTR